MSECTNCGSHHTEVKDSRHATLVKTRMVRRRRECYFCKTKYTTYEIPDEMFHRIRSFLDGDKLDKLDRLISEIRNTVKSK